MELFSLYKDDAGIWRANVKVSPDESLLLRMGEVLPSEQACLDMAQTVLDERAAQAEALEGESLEGEPAGGE